MLFHIKQIIQNSDELYEYEIMKVAWFPRCNWSVKISNIYHNGLGEVDGCIYIVYIIIWMARNVYI